MTYLRPHPGGLVALVLFALVPPLAGAEAGGSAASAAARTRYRHIRTTETHLLALIHEGVDGSRTFRALVQRLEQSDVVVYVQCERDRAPASRIAGRLTFVATAGGFRYVVVRVLRLPSRVQLIALLAHELQHAVEIADNPAIVDSLSLAREYTRIGHVTSSSGAGVTFDSEAAVVAGQRVLDDMAAMAGD